MSSTITSTPEPCALHPELVTEYPARHELSDELTGRIDSWVDAATDGCDYHGDLSVAPGWKVGGWGPWSFSDSYPMPCGECGTELLPLLTIDSTEGDTVDSWWPVEDADAVHDSTPYPSPSSPTQSLSAAVIRFSSTAARLPSPTPACR